MKKWLLAGLFLPLSAGACEGLRIAALQRTVELTRETKLALTFDVVAETSSACHFFVTFGRGSALSAPGRRLVRGAEQWPFNLYKEVSRSKILRDHDEAPGSDQMFEGDFSQAPGWSRKTFTYHAVLDTARPRTPGLYEDDISISVFEGTPANPNFVSSERVRFRAEAFTRIGALAQGALVTIDANVDYEVSLSAEGRAGQKKTNRLIKINGEEKTVSAAADDFVVVTIQPRK